ncbi:hypothetical protein I350_06416 [Cryptococcus amylolentus CBS 6273]|uniref:Uncharacterized protein n=1 Tax=Cryptococcus amylolentus CBS 6273 TaxID=1296118 RepID=A0A1E3JLS4_9TREE|nr:hypothetical protein I350_06416 [Cryptococcus amylolentus CBS 6273]
MTFPEPAHAPSSPGNSHKSHATSSSADFGAFTSAAPATPHSVHHLGEADLLGSYEDDQHVAKPQRGQPPPSPGAWPSAFDPLATGSTEIPPDPPHLPTNPIDRHSVSPPATYISLPPRPTEISPNYVPHARTRRLSSFAVATSPTSPPIFTDTGDETVFHPAHQSSGNTALGSIQKVQRKSSTSPTSSRVKLPTPRSSILWQQQQSLPQGGSLRLLRKFTLQPPICLGIIPEATMRCLHIKHLHHHFQYQ